MRFCTAHGKAVRCTYPSNVHLCKHSMTGLSHKKTVDYQIIHRLSIKITWRYYNSQLLTQVAVCAKVRVDALLSCSFFTTMILYHVFFPLSIDFFHFFIIFTLMSLRFHKVFFFQGCLLNVDENNILVLHWLPHDGK